MRRKNYNRKLKELADAVNVHLQYFDREKQEMRWEKNPATRHNWIVAIIVRRQSPARAKKRRAMTWLGLIL